MDISKVQFETSSGVSRYANRGAVENINVKAVKLDVERNNTQKSSRNESAFSNVNSNEDITKIVDDLNEAINHMNERISFSYDENTNRIVVRVLDRDTNEVVREIPSKEALKLLEHLRDFVGMLVDESR
jgi:flagellar protein FlaG